MPSAGSTSTASVRAGHRPRKCAPVPRVRTGCGTFLLYRSAWPARFPNERLTRQNLQELYRGASHGDQHPIVLHETRKAP